MDACYGRPEQRTDTMARLDRRAQKARQILLRGRGLPGKRACRVRQRPGLAQKRIASVRSGLLGIHQSVHCKDGLLDRAQLHRDAVLARRYAPKKRTGNVRSLHGRPQDSTGSVCTSRSNQEGRQRVAPRYHGSQRGI